jgi:hypothetical protein
MIKNKIIFVSVLIMLLISGVIQMCSAQNIIQPAFNVDVPEKWEITLNSSSNIKISNPDINFNFIGINLGYAYKMADTSPENYLNLLARDLPEQFESQFEGFKSGGSKVYTRKDKEVLLYTFSFDIPGSKDKGQATQWIFPVNSYFLATLFYTAPEFSAAPSEKDVLSNIFESFTLKPAWEQYHQGLKAYFSGRYKIALDFFKKSLETETNDSWLWYYAGLSTQAVSGLEKLDYSSDCFAKAATINPANLPALNQLSACFMAVNDFERAHEILNDALNQDPFDEESLLNKTKLFLKEKKGDQALECITLLVSRHPDSKEGIQIKNKLVELKNDALKK